MHKILAIEVNLKFEVGVSFLLPNYGIYYTVLKRETFKSGLSLLVRMNVSERAQIFYRTAFSFTKISKLLL